MSLKVFLPKSKRERSVLELWRSWIDVQTHEVGAVGWFISAEDMRAWDDALADFVKEQAKIPKGYDW